MQERWINSVFVVFSSVVIRLTELLLFQHTHCNISDMCWCKSSVFVLVHPFPKLLFFTPLWWHFTLRMFFFFFFPLCEHYIAKEYKETVWDFVWNAWHCQNTGMTSVNWNVVCSPFFFFIKHKLTIVFGFSNAYRILYEIVDSLWCTVAVYFSSLFSTVVAHCISMPLLITTCHTLRALLQHSLHFVKLCNGWSCACRAASCLDNVISLWISLKQYQSNYLFNWFKCLTVVSVTLVM